MLPRHQLAADTSVTIIGAHLVITDSADFTTPASLAGPVTGNIHRRTKTGQGYVIVKPVDQSIQAVDGSVGGKSGIAGMCVDYQIDGCVCQWRLSLQPQAINDVVRNHVPIW